MMRFVKFYTLFVIIFRTSGHPVNGGHLVYQLAPLRKLGPAGGQKYIKLTVSSFVSQL